MTEPPTTHEPDFPYANQPHDLDALTLALAHADRLTALADALAKHLSAVVAYDAAWLCLPTSTMPIGDSADVDACAEGRLSGFASVLASGALLLAQRAANAYTPADITRVERVGAHVAAALTRIDHLARLRERVDVLEIQNQELDAYDYSAAHDLKAPLNIINNYAFLLNDVLGDGDIDEALKYTAEIMQTARGMARLLDQLLMVTRVADENDIPPVTAVRPVLEQVIAQFRQPLDDGGIALEVDGAPPDVRAYPVQLETIFSNLIGNAIKYMGATENPTIHVRGVRQEHDARFEVRDNGIGMDEAEQAKLFRRFSRVGKADTEGTGLGLAIARRTVERLGGTLGVTSAPGQGSTFWFTLPVGD